MGPPDASSTPFPAVTVQQRPTVSSAFSLRTSYISNTSDKAGWNNLKCAFSGIFQNEYLALESVSVLWRSLRGAHRRQAQRKQQPGHLWRNGLLVPKDKYCLKSPMNGLSDL